MGITHGPWLYFDSATFYEFHSSFAIVMKLQTRELLCHYSVWAYNDKILRVFGESAIAKDTDVDFQAKCTMNANSAGQQNWC